jgi:hypothetical protein
MTLGVLEVRLHVALVARLAAERGARGLLLAGTGEVRRYWAAPPCIPQDLDCNGSVGPTDIAILLSAWGACGKGTCVADIDRDGLVGPADLAALLAAWG